MSDIRVLLTGPTGDPDHARNLTAGRGTAVSTMARATPRAPLSGVPAGRAEHPLGPGEGHIRAIGPDGTWA